ncbi:MAG: 23S rRNA (adenine(2503)-C(2))-methyltransferase RlmN [Spirochaetaceae bacterium]
MIPEDDPALLGLDRTGCLEQCFRAIHGRDPGQVSAETRTAARMAGRLRSRVTRTVRDGDGTTKLRIALSDGNQVESVLLRDEKTPGAVRLTACLSTQAGCAVGCRFCRTGSMGLRRNLSGQEILEQYLHLQRRFGTVSNVVFMGMGEPLHNTDAVLGSVRVLAHPLGPGISLNRITISTSGVTRGIRRLAEAEHFSPRAGGRPRLAISLITARPEVRARLIPTPPRRGREAAAILEDLRAAVWAYQSMTGRAVTFEIVLMDGVTDTDEDAAALIAFLRGGAHGAGGRFGSLPPLRGEVNLIVWNPVDELPFHGSAPDRVDRFAERLLDAGIVVTYRFPRGTRNRAGCGQLGVSS